MRPPSREHDPPDRPPWTANERLKRGSRARYHWSIVGSVLAHAALILGWPAFETRTPSELRPAGAGGYEIVALGALPAPPGGAGRIEPVAAEPDEREGRGGTEDGEDGAEDARALPGLEAAWRAYGSERGLARLRGLRAEVLAAADSDAPADSTDARGERVAGDEEAGGLDLPGGGSELVYEQLSREEMLELERLSALRPELALLSPNQWLMVRNPVEVGDFMRRHFGLPAEDEGPRGYLSVSVWIDERGSVEWAEINRSSGRPEVDATALELFRDVVAFRPARDGGLRVPVAAIFWLMW